MKLYVLSDLHVEFAPFVPDLAAAEAADVVVLAGDIHTAALGMAWAREAFPAKPIIYVAGNHEFYKQHWDAPKYSKSVHSVAPRKRTPSMVTTSFSRK